MSDIVKLRNDGCQAGFWEDEMQVTTETLSPLLQFHNNKGRGANLLETSRGTTVRAGFGI